MFPLPITTEKPTEILECDEKTPDSHVARDARLIRLTGIHPFNCEPPLKLLYDHGFLTPTELWFVRNHGPVPKISDEDISNWTIHIEGMIENPMSFTLNELFKFPQITIPVTMVCAGNRRKEQNIIRKGHGFNWGSAAVSTALFTGILINEILQLTKPKLETKYMWMEGIDQLPNGHYGTSIRLSTAMNPSMGVMLAYKMNGEFLRPDHGRPLRIVIPGHIGGRSVKWLKRIILSDKPSDNWYHIYDNRVLPTMVTPEIVEHDKSWYKDERYALYNLNIQSVICYPTHDEIIEIEEDKYYHIRGYAYNGGGIRVGRVEISLDQGQTWKLTTINYPEDLYRKIKSDEELFGGKLDMSNRESCFCWCFWNIEISINELSKAKDILVRAMDESMNIQPRDIYWNILSMLNNCWHRITITKQDNTNQLLFEHPTIPGLTKGGWMEKVKEQGRNLIDGFWGSQNEISNEYLSSNIKMTNDSITEIITEEELSKHNKNDDTWIAINGNVYDVTRYLKEHPGGANSILLSSGTDASEDFLAIHSDHAKSLLTQYHIGILKTNSNNDTQREVFLSQKQWRKAKLEKKINVNHDTILFTFTLEHSKQTLGVPLGKHLFIRCFTELHTKLIRAYTPISEPNQCGTFDLLIKLYRTPKAGKMSLCMNALKPGDTIECKGPFGDFEYHQNKIFSIHGIERKINKLTMIAGGSGITGIYQIFQHAFRDHIQCNLIYFNKTEKDILLHDELQSLKQVQFIITRLNTNSNQHLTLNQIQDVHDGLLLCCGPPEMSDDVYQLANDAGWNVNEQFIRF
ncbi:unnamed protein product [Adineta ricciae]|uniref:Nitrate reductase [NADPH] n=1 Tax=Adineta ricciae TaxID=249248 RepID=A0A815AT29_ADIRI|nr:unnamed protein product [Adineta ricciae]CAF1303539.1 unnamed protein product [Adineta ricciae]